jgi:hypothetical protein
MEGALPVREDSRRFRRMRLRILDACLKELEEAHERGEQTLSEGLTARLAPSITGLAPGMLLTEAIHIVFAEQSLCLRQAVDREDVCAVPVPANPRALDLASPVSAGTALDEHAARRLTERIRAGAQEVCILLLQAHNGRAWSALGYHSWKQYVRSEFGLSRSRAYELLDHAHVIRAVQNAVGMSGLPNISANTAVKIKPHLLEIIEAVKRRIAAVPEDQLAEAVTEAIRLERSRLEAGRGQRGGRSPILSEPEATAGFGMLHAAPMDELEARAGGSDQSVHCDLAQLSWAVNQLATMPPVGETIAQLPADADRSLSRLSVAQRWLNEFVSAWRRRPGSPRPRLQGAAARGLIGAAAQATGRRPSLGRPPGPEGITPPGSRRPPAARRR